jgi:hypothetical protein
MECPTSVDDIRSSLGLVGYYRKFIEAFPKITKPMTKLLGKGKKYKWMAACVVSFFFGVKEATNHCPIVSNTCYGEVFLNLL